MKTVAAVMTGKGSGAISTIQLCGNRAEGILHDIFKSKSIAELQQGKSVLGKIITDNKTIDEVVVGCEGDNQYAINCHGNPLIVSDIIRLLGENGAEIVSPEKMTALSYKGSNTIKIEVNIALSKAKTLHGNKLLLNQQFNGLTSTLRNWQDDNVSFDNIKSQAQAILNHSVIANRSIYGVKIVLTGPPNSGKSTLLNTLAGKQKAIVTDIEGTTRDWVSADCMMGGIFATIVDTAGLDDELFDSSGQIDKISQQKTKELLYDADLLLLVLENSKQQSDFKYILRDFNTLTVINKYDLNKNNDNYSFSISAKTGLGIDELINAIKELLGIDQIDIAGSVCFTERQKELMAQIITVKSKDEALSVISELLNGKLCV